MLIVRVISRLRKAAVALKARRTKRQKASKRTSVLVMATLSSLTHLRKAVATIIMNTAVTTGTTVQVESARKWTKTMETLRAILRSRFE